MAHGETHDGSRCFECGLPAKHNHHVVPQSIGGTKTVPLCEACHGRIHNLNLSTSALTKDALQHKRSRGEVFGTIPLGFERTEDGRLAENADEMATVQRARDLRASGLSLRQIARTLEREGRATKSGGKWHAVTVAKIVNRAPIGESACASA